MVVWLDVCVGMLFWCGSGIVWWVLFVGVGWVCWVCECGFVVVCFFGWIVVDYLIEFFWNVLLCGWFDGLVVVICFVCVILV